MISKNICFTCNKFKKDKYTKHCYYCDKCVEDFDHHCYWVNNCISKKNMKFFFIFLIMIIINLTYNSYLTLNCFVGNVNYNFDEYLQKDEKEKMNYFKGDNFMKNTSNLYLSKDKNIEIKMEDKIFSKYQKIKSKKEILFFLEIFPPKILGDFFYKKTVRITISLCSFTICFGFLLPLM